MMLFTALAAMIPFQQQAEMTLLLAVKAVIPLTAVTVMTLMFGISVTGWIRFQIPAAPQHCNSAKALPWTI